MNPRTNSFTPLASLLAAFVLLVTTGLLVACGGSDDEASPPTGTSPTAATTDAEVTELGTVTVSESECRLEAAFENPIGAGAVALTAVNETNDVAAVHMWSLQEGATYEEFADYTKEERRLAEAGEEGLGHPPFVVELVVGPTLEAGQSVTVEGIVRSGTTYGITCLKMFKSEDGEPIDEFPRPLVAVGPVETADR